MCEIANKPLLDAQRAMVRVLNIPTGDLERLSVDIMYPHYVGNKTLSSTEREQLLDCIEMAIALKRVRKITLDA